MTQSTLSKAISRGLLGCLGFGMLVGGLSQQAKAFNILPGSDYLLTPDDNGTSFVFDDIGQVFFKGVPLGPYGLADTIIERKKNAIFDTNNDGKLESTLAIIPIEMTALSLISTSEVCLGIDCYLIKPQLNATPSAGSMKISHNFIDLGGGMKGFDDSPPHQGTFTSDFIVNFDAHFIPISTAPALNPITGLSIRLINPGACWAHAPTIPPSPLGFFPCDVQHVKFDGSAFTEEGHSTKTVFSTVVPGPLPVLGLGAAFSFSRRLRKKCQTAAKAA